ncbi:MAG: carboxypeptidase-like regulatory domain-containing protein, partial [Planctomycetota bacterium]|nr:carboxypeptidase-like regulatory domain-containing protein [Planctomycetota bacterium]
ANRRVKLNRIQTDAEGRFELNVIGKDLLFFNNIWIWHEGYSLAAPSLYQFIPGAVEHTKPEVILQPESLVRFRIERPDGKSLKNANVYPAEMVIPNATEPVDGMHGLYSFLPDDELKKFATRTTNDHGEVELPHVPADVLSAVGVATDEFGVQEFDIRSLTGPKRLTMEPVGRLIGTAPPGTRIEIQSRRGGTTIIGEGRANVVADSDGHFEVKALARGRVTITPYNSENSEWLMEDQFVILEPASMLTIDIVPQATIPATGRLVHADSKLPIANARVALQVASSTRTWLGSVVTDADGKFRSRCLPGKQFVAQLIMLPEAEMLYPKPTQLMFQVPVDAKSFELPNIEIRTAKIGKGKLVDANNNPVAGKYVQHYFDNKPIDDPSRTDDNGEFEYVIDKEIITDRWAAVLKWDLRDKSGNAGSANDRFEVEATVISDDPLVLQIDDPE